MRTALRDMQPWRRSLVEHGLTIGWLAGKTGKSRDTVKAYAAGQRIPPAEWLTAVDAVIAQHVRERAS